MEYKISGNPGIQYLLKYLIISCKIF